MNESSKTKPLSREQMAELYLLPVTAFNMLIEQFETEIGEQIGMFYSEQQVKIIFDRLAVPFSLLDKAVQNKIFSLSPSFLKARVKSPEQN